MRPAKPPSFYYCGRAHAAAETAVALRNALQNTTTQGQSQPASPRTQRAPDADRATLLPNGRVKETLSFYRCRMFLAAINTAAAILPILSCCNQPEKKNISEVAEIVFNSATYSVRALTFILTKPHRLLINSGISTRGIPPRNNRWRRSNHSCPYSRCRTSYSQPRDHTSNGKTLALYKMSF